MLEANTETMNMMALKPSRRRPTVGDVFVYKLKQRSEYGFGRVVCTDSSLPDLRPGRGDTIIVYLYNAFSIAATPLPALNRDNLLIPPFGTNRLPWSRGFFDVVSRGPLRPTDVLPRHCFEHVIYVKPRFTNEYGELLAERAEPCGIWALEGFGSIDVAISRALGVPHVALTATGVVVRNPLSGDRPETVNPPGRLTVHIRLSGDQLVATADIDSVYEVENRLGAALAASDVGEVDGHELTEGLGTVFCYGPRINPLVEVVLTELRSGPLPAGTYVTYSMRGAHRRVDV